MNYKTMTIYRTGPVILRRWAIDTSLDYEPGDLLYWDNSAAKVKPASAFTWDTNIATTAAAFADLFVGICWGRHDITAVGYLQDTTILVDESAGSIYDYPLDSGTYSPIAKLSCTNGGSGTVLLDQKLRTTSTAAEAIARPSETKGGTITSMLATFSPVTRTNSAAGNAAIG